MSIQNYGELKTAVANWLQRSNLTDRIPEFIQLAEDRISNELDMPLLEQVASLTIDDQRVALPSDFLEQRSHYIDVADPIQRVTYVPPERLWDFDQNKAADFPTFYTIEGGELVFSPTPDSSYTGKWLYLARPLRLSADADTNDILKNHIGLYLYGSLIEGVGYKSNDPRLLTWSSFYENAMELAQALGRRQRFPKGQKIMRSRVPVSSGGRTKM